MVAVALLLIERILELIQPVPPSGKRNVLAFYAHALAALACQKKSLEEDVPLGSLAEAWNSPMAKPMREYIDVWGAGYQISSMTEDFLKNLCDSLTTILPEGVSEREAFYACVKLLYVSQFWGKIGQISCTTSQLSKTAPEVIFEILDSLEEKVPTEVTDKYANILYWDATEATRLLWPRLYGFLLEKREIRQSGKVSDGLALLEQTGLELERKLQIYSCARLGVFWRRDDSVENPFRYLRKMFFPDNTQLESNEQGKVLSLVQEGDALSFQVEYFTYETVFDQAIDALKSVEPVRFFLATGQYSLRRTELATELSVAVKPFLQRDTTDNVIVEPNPLAMELANELGTMCLLAFLSLETAYLYLTQFPDLNIGYLHLGEQPGLYRLHIEARSRGKGKRDNRFFRIESVTSIQDTLIFLRRETHDRCREVLSAIHPILGDNSSIDLFAPSDVLQGNVLEGLPYDLHSGTILPSYQKDSAKGTRKKYMIYAMKKRDAASEENRPAVSLYKLISVEEDDKTYLAYFPYTVAIPFDILCENDNHSLTWYWNQFNPAREAAKQRKTREFRYSAEISLWYSWSPGSKSGRYYFSALPSQKQKTHNRISRGKRLTESVQYRAATEEEAIKTVAAGLTREGFRQTIKKELEKLHKTDGMSLKTYFYCYGEELAVKPTYDRKKAEWLFASEVFDTLRTGAAYTLEDYQQVMDGILAAIPNKIVRLQYWDQLNLLLNYAERAGHIDRNPVRSFIYDAKENDEQYRAIRAGLSKKSFTMQEERTLVEYLERELPENSRLLGCAIRFFTGMGIPEILALTWDDFNKLTFLDAGYFFVTKEMKKKQIDRYAADDPKVRLVPCCPQLYGFLLARRDYIEKALGNAKKRLGGLPIISADNADFTKRASVDQLRVATAAFLKQAGISENEIRLPTKNRPREQDINKYHGDLLRANFEYRATETCRMTPGEIAYILGRQPPDTFSRHYCDYGNIESQTILARKLMRWDALRRREDLPRLYHTEKRPIPGSETLILRSKTYDRPYLTELWVDATSAGSGAVSLEILDQSGADIAIISED